MKRIAFIIALYVSVSLSLYGTTPYNLEGIKALNVLLTDQDDLLSPKAEEALLMMLKKRLELSGISSEKDGVGAMFVKLTAIEVGESRVVHVTLGIGEEAVIVRSKAVESFVLSYSYEDMIKTKDAERDIYETVIDFLFDEFLEQFEEDNDL